MYLRSHENISQSDSPRLVLQIRGELAGADRPGLPPTNLVVSQEILSILFPRRPVVSNDVHTFTALSAPLFRKQWTLEKFQLARLFSLIVTRHTRSQLKDNYRTYRTTRAGPLSGQANVRQTLLRYTGTHVGLDRAPGSRGNSAWSG